MTPGDCLRVRQLIAAMAITVSATLLSLTTQAAATNLLSRYWTDEKRLAVMMRQLAYAIHTLQLQPNSELPSGGPVLNEYLVANNVCDEEFISTLAGRHVSIALETMPGQVLAIQITYPGKSVGPEDDILVQGATPPFSVQVESGHYWRTIEPIGRRIIVVLAALGVAYLVATHLYSKVARVRRADRLNTLARNCSVVGLGCAVSALCWDGEQWRGSLFQNPLVGRIVFTVGIVVAVAVPLTVRAAAALRNRVLRSILVKKRCLCGYDLSCQFGASCNVVCPECGRRHDRLA